MPPIRTNPNPSPAELELDKGRVARCRLYIFNAGLVLGQNALKSVILINGGAAVALLAFIGHIWPKEQPSQLIHLGGSLQWFVYGVFFAAVASGITYVTQIIYAVYFQRRETIGFKSGLVLHGVVFLFAVTSY